MATLLIDDGTFEEGNTFVTLAECEEYHSNRTNTLWTGTDTEKTSAIIRSFDYLSIQRWRDYVLEDEIPLKVKQAQCVAALKELIEPGCLQKDQTKDDNVKKKKIDVIETEYFDKDMQTKYTVIENLLKDYIIEKKQSIKRTRTLIRG